MTLCARGCSKWFTDIYQFTILQYFLCPLYSKISRTTERLENLSKVTELVCGGARIWSCEVSLQVPHTQTLCYSLLHRCSCLPTWLRLLRLSRTSAPLHTSKFYLIFQTNLQPSSYEKLQNEKYILYCAAVDWLWTPIAWWFRQLHLELNLWT